MEWILYVVAFVLIGGLALRGKLNFKKKQKAIKAIKNKVYKWVLVRYNDESLAYDIHTLMNDYIEQQTGKRLKPELGAKRMATNRVEEMIKDGKASHDGFGDDASELLQLGAKKVGENIAFGYGTAKGVVRAWIKSEGHRMNMINKKYDTMYVHVGHDENGRKYFCAAFLDKDGKI